MTCVFETPPGIPQTKPDVASRTWMTTDQGLACSVFSKFSQTCPSLKHLGFYAINQGLTMENLQAVSMKSFSTFARLMWRNSQQGSIFSWLL